MLIISINVILSCVRYDHLLTCAALATVRWTPLAIPMLTVNYPTHTGNYNLSICTAIYLNNAVGQ